MNQTERALKRHRQRLLILNEAAEALGGSGNPEAAFSTLYDRVLAHFSLDGIIELRLNAPGTALELAAVRLTPRAKWPRTNPLVLGQGIAGKVAETRRPIVVANTQASIDPDFDWVKRMGAKAYVCQPLVVADRLLGTLSFVSCRRNSFPLEDQQFFRTLANYVALARERFRVSQELQKHNVNLKESVRERTAHLVEANANLQMLAHMIAHELLSPLRLINRFASLVIDKFGQQLGLEGQLYVGKMAASADDIDKLFSDLLEYAKLSHTELPLERIELSIAVKEALRHLQEDIHSKEGTVTIAEPLPPVFGHTPTVILVIRNFVSNALKFMAPGVRPKIRINTERSGAFTRILVEDNGVGIESQDQGRLFQVFQRVHGKHIYPGTGLGLAIARRAVESMGGDVGLKSEPGKGSCFWAELLTAPETPLGKAG